MRGKRLFFIIFAAILVITAVAMTVIASRTYQNFQKDFLSNLLSDFFVGALLGSIIALWITNRQRESEKASEEKDRRRRASMRGISHLEILRDDIDSLLPKVKSWKDNIANSDRGFEAITGNQLNLFEYRLWSVVQNDSELTSLLDPDLIRRLTYFYGALTDAREALDWAIQGWKVTGGGPTTVARMRRFETRVNECIRSADRWGEHLVTLIDAEIDVHQSIVKALSE